MKVFCSPLPIMALWFASVAFAQTTYTYTSVDYPDAKFTQLHGINSTGAIVGVYSTTKEAHQAVYSFLRSADGSFQPLLAGTPSNVAGISDSGVIVGSADNTGFILSQTFTPVKVSDDSTYLTGISTNNSLVGSFAIASGHAYGFQSNSGKFTQLPYYKGEPLQPSGINDAGTIVGYPTADFEAGFILPSGGPLQTVQYPAAIETTVAAINDAGVLAGSEFTIAGSYPQGFTENGTVFSDVIYPGSSATYPLGINNNGVVVGYYLDAKSLIHGFIATPLP